MRLITVFCIILIGLSISSASYAVNCEVDNDALRSMPFSTLTATRTDGSTFEVQVRTANTGQTRAAGFQRVCAETIAKTPILFLFKQSSTPSFHMNNVVASLDIAFIKPEGAIDSIQKMHPYVLILLNKPLYSPSSPVIGALEAHPGFFEEHNIDVNSKLSWVLN